MRHPARCRLPRDFILRCMVFNVKNPANKTKEMSP
jgi:hypothetical protein